MKKHKRTKVQLNARSKARHAIIEAVNKFIGKRDHSERVLGMKNLNECVCIARRNKLVPNKTLVMAGFNKIGASK